MTLPITLAAGDLWSKYGFEDGDILDHVLWDYEEDHGLKFGSLRGRAHEALLVLVRQSLLPALPRPVEVEFIMTNHNPVRVSDWSTGAAPADMAHVSVDVTIDQVVEAVRGLPPRGEED